jgi:outer membrane protein assembly factor BamD (BamD/ComL family)
MLAKITLTLKQAHLQLAQAHAQTKNYKRACFANADKFFFKKFPNAKKK